MRIKFRRFLLPIFFLLIAVIAGVWLYSSYTDLDFFTIRNHDSTAGPCAEKDSLPMQDFHVHLLQYLADDSDQSLVNTFLAAKSLSRSLADSTACVHVLSMKQVADETVVCLRSLMEWKSYTNDSNHLAAAGMTTDSFDLKAILLADALGNGSALHEPKYSNIQHLEKLIESSQSTNASLGFKDSLVNQLIQSAMRLNEALVLWNEERNHELVALAEARTNHGVKIEEARTRIFMISLVAWMVSLMVISLLYVKSVVRRSSDLMPPSMALNDVDMDKDLPPGQSPLPNQNHGDSQAIAPAPMMVADLDLSKVFFDCGGDIQLMKKTVNRHMTTTFAAIGNLKTYQRSDNHEGAVRVLRVLSTSNAQLGFTSVQSRIDGIIDQLSVLKSDRWNGMGDLLLELTRQVEILRDRLGNHPAFKN